MHAAVLITKYQRDAMTTILTAHRMSESMKRHVSIRWQFTPFLSEKWLLLVTAADRYSEFLPSHGWYVCADEQKKTAHTLNHSMTISSSEKWTKSIFARDELFPTEKPTKSLYEMLCTFGLNAERVSLVLHFLRCNKRLILHACYR